uniref:Uncharacterized protein n=1 Tax=Graphocephala atropunctata TaxID=36148 RepID=A0A1B6LVJ9_9HEMI
MAWDLNANPPGYDLGYYPYGHGWPPEEPKETEAEKLQREKEEKERIEAIQENRLFLKKVKKQCVLEDFVDLKRHQIFLFEVMIEKMEVKGASSLGILTENQDSRMVAKVQFLNSSFMDIYENPIERPQNEEESQNTDYLQTLSEAKRKDIYASTEGKPSGVAEEDEVDKDLPVVKWEKAVGKSFLFSKTALELIQDLERYPVVVQVSRCNADSTICDPVGYARVRLPDDFSISILQSGKKGVILPVISVHKEACDIVNVFNVKKGTLELYFRLSSFGPVIATSFQSINDYRQYVFKPGPIDTGDTPEKEESEDSKRKQALKPIIAEEEKAVGITVLKELDIFQLPVLWQQRSSERVEKETKKEFKCCKKSTAVKVCSLPEKSKLELPQTSKTDLCRDVLSSTDQKTLRKFGNSQCDWHNLVSLQVKNSPGTNCGCLQKQNEAPGDKNISRNPSRVLKMQRSSKVLTGLGITPEKEDCLCDCPYVKDALNSKKMFLI